MISTESRFWAKVDQTSGCWLWTGALNDVGRYGVFWNGERVVMAHRWSYEHHVGPIPDGLTVDHLCLVKRCVNPAHFELVTLAENGRRGSPYTGATHCKHGHEFTPANTVIRTRPQGGRDCRACGRSRRAKRSVA